jgi:hypothetical protein
VRRPQSHAVMRASEIRPVRDSYRIVAASRTESVHSSTDAPTPQRFRFTGFWESQRVEVSEAAYKTLHAVSKVLQRIIERRDASI